MSMADLQGPALSVFIGAVAVAVIGIVGVITGTWRAEWTGLLLILLGVAGAAIVWVGASKALQGKLPFAGRYVELLVGLVATVIGIGGIVDRAFDLDEAGDEGFILGLIVYVALAAAGLFVLLMTGRGWPGGAGAIAAPVRAGAERGGRLAFLGVLLVLLGWLVNITLGNWNWHPAALGTFLILLVAVIVLMIGEDAFDPRIPPIAAWVAAIIAIWAGVIALVEHLQGFLGSDSSPGIGEWVGMILYVGGVIVVIVGTVLMALAAGPVPGMGSPDEGKSPPAPPAE
jgi:hypothetical protein